MNDGNNVSKWRAYRRGLKAAASGNAQAFGFSIVITVSYGIVASSTPTPSRREQIAFALSAVAAFSLLNIVVALLAPVDSSAMGSNRALLIATATDFVAVGASLAVAMGIASLLAGLPAWICIPFAAALTYILVQAVELTLGREAEK